MMTRPKPLQRERYCDIKATSLQEVLDTCKRHIRNIGKTQADYIMEGDGTPTDDFYCDMFRQSWMDLHDDVQAMLDNPKVVHPLLDTRPESTTLTFEPSTIEKAMAQPQYAVFPHEYTVHVVEHTESERGFGQRPDGYTAHRTEAEAIAYINSQTKERTYPTPDEYVMYHYIGIKVCGVAFKQKLDASKSGWAYFDKFTELK